MATAEFVTISGRRFFSVGDARPKLYSVREGQSEIYRNKELSLHALLADGDWVACRLYLIAGRRRRTWHFGVNVAERRASRVECAYQLEAESPAVMRWVIAFICGEHREAPALGSTVDAALSCADYDKAIDLIEASSADGVGWSFWPNTRRKGRYVVDNLCQAMPGVSEKVAFRLVQDLAMADVLRSEVIDSRMKRLCIVVNRDKVAPARERGRLGGNANAE